MSNFTKIYSRKDTGSSKWEKMYAAKPDVEEGIIPMSVADMDFLASDEIINGLCHYIQNNILGYSKPTDSYKEAVINFFKTNHDYICEKDWIVTSPGIVPALFTAVRAFTKFNDGVIIMTPIYPPFYSAISSQGRNIELCPLLNNNNYYEIDFKLLEDLAKKESSKLLLLCSPHNPGGRVWKKDELIKIAEIADKYNLIVVSDEIHSDIILPGNEHIVFSNTKGNIANRSVICTAASKSFNIAGLQCSNIIISNEYLRNKFIEENDNIGFERANVLGMKATEFAYTKSLDWLSNVRKLITSHHEIVNKFFDNYKPYFKVMKAEATFLAWVNFENLEKDDKKFINFLEQDCNFFVNEGSMFGEESKYYFRINLGLPTMKLQENLERLKVNLKTHYNI